MPSSTARWTLWLGYVIPIVFFATTIICGWIQGDYNHLSRLVSELGALGTRSQYVFSTGLVTCSILSFLFLAGLWRACRAIGISSLPVFLILSYSVSIGGAGIFPLPLRLHLILGMPSVLLIFSPMLSLLLWTRMRRLPHIALMSSVGFLVMSLGFLAFMPGLLPEYPGLKQRLFHAGWSIWFISLSYSFTRVLVKNQ